MIDRATYDKLTVARVRAAMQRHLGPDQAATTKQIAAEMGLRDDRRLRAILADHDGDAMLLGKTDAGIFMAETPEQAARFTAELTSKIRTELARLRRRKRFAKWMTLPPVEQLEQLGFGIAS